MSADLGPADPAMHHVKAQIVAELRRITIERQLSEREVGALWGLSQLEAVELLNGDVREQVLDRLIAFLTALGCDMEIVSRPRSTRDDQGGWITLKIVAA